MATAASRLDNQPRLAQYPSSKPGKMSLLKCNQGSEIRSSLSPRNPSQWRRRNFFSGIQMQRQRGRPLHPSRYSTHLSVWCLSISRKHCHRKPQRSKVRCYNLLKSSPASALLPDVIDLGTFLQSCTDCMIKACGLCSAQRFPMSVCRDFRQISIQNHLCERVPSSLRWRLADFRPCIEFRAILSPESVAPTRQSVPEPLRELAQKW